MAVILCILDGWGASPDAEGKNDAIHLATTPNYDCALRERPHTFLNASGKCVGIPEGQMGNSEVGHMTMGAGGPIDQQLLLINNAIERNELKQADGFIELIEYHRLHKGSVCHVIGMLSDGGVHSHIDHILHALQILSDEGISVNLHVIADGRDVAPRSVVTYISAVRKFCQGMSVKIVSMIGRVYAMDRDNRWERTKSACDMIMMGIGESRFHDCIDAAHSFYDDNISDEFFPPAVLYGYEGMRRGDSVLMMNFRSDRLRQIMNAIGDSKCSYLVALFHYSGMRESTRYIMSSDKRHLSLGKIVSDSKKKQLRLAETEKYAHVTHFFNCGDMEAYPGESRIMLNSPKVLSYDATPGMSAKDITDALITAIESDAYDLIVVNYANADMIGHTGNFSAAIKAAEILDECLGRVISACEESGSEMILTADHGNMECMYNEVTQQPHTAHTSNLVPCIYFGKKELHFKESGELGNIANSVLRLMNLSERDDMLPGLFVESDEY